MVKTCESVRSKQGSSTGNFQDPACGHGQFSILKLLVLDLGDAATSSNLAKDNMIRMGLTDRPMLRGSSKPAANTASVRQRQVDALFAGGYEKHPYVSWKSPHVLFRYIAQNM